MEYLHTSLVLLLLFCSSSAGKTFFTHLGTKCIDDCKYDLYVYKCKSIDKDGKCRDMYCSPQEERNFQGRYCQYDSTCGKHGEDYYWCKVNSFTWGYCGLVIDDTNHTVKKTLLIYIKQLAARFACIKLWFYSATTVIWNNKNIIVHTISCLILQSCCDTICIVKNSI